MNRDPQNYWVGKTKQKILEWKGRNLKLILTVIDERNEKKKKKTTTNLFGFLFLYFPLCLFANVLLFFQGFFCKAFLCVVAKLIQSIFRFIFKSKVVDSSARSHRKLSLKLSIYCQHSPLSCSNVAELKRGIVVVAADLYKQTTSERSDDNKRSS